MHRGVGFFIGSLAHRTRWLAVPMCTAHGRGQGEGPACMWVRAGGGLGSGWDGNLHSHHLIFFTNFWVSVGISN